MAAPNLYSGILSGMLESQDRQRQASLDLANRVYQQHAMSLEDQNLDLAKQRQAFTESNADANRQAQQAIAELKAKVDLSKVNERKLVGFMRQAATTFGNIYKGGSANPLGDFATIFSQMLNSVGGDVFDPEEKDTIQKSLGQYLPSSQPVNATVPQTQAQPLPIPSSGPQITPGMFGRMAGQQGAPMTAPQSLMPPMPATPQIAPQGALQMPVGMAQSPVAGSIIRKNDTTGTLNMAKAGTEGARTQNYLSMANARDARTPGQIALDAARASYLDSGGDLNDARATKIYELIDGEKALLEANKKRADAVSGNLVAQTGFRNLQRQVLQDDVDRADKDGMYVSIGGRPYIPPSEQKIYLDQYNRAQKYTTALQSQISNVDRELMKQADKFYQTKAIADKATDPAIRAAYSGMLQSMAGPLSDLQERSKDLHQQLDEAKGRTLELLEKTAGFGNRSQPGQIQAGSGVLPGFAAPTGVERIPGMGLVQTYPPGKAPKSQEQQPAPQSQPTWLTRALMGKTPNSGIIFQGNGYTVRKKR